MLHACGLNAHRQLTDKHNEDIFTPTKFLNDDNNKVDAVDYDIIFAGWSEIVLQSDRGLFSSTGRISQDNDIWPHPISKAQSSASGRQQKRPFKYGFGDHNGLLGALDMQGNVYLRDVRDMVSGILALQSQSVSSLQISDIALAGNGRVAIALTMHNAPGDEETVQIYEFTSLDEFKEWYDLAIHGDDLPPCDSCYIIPSHGVVQLVANTTTFACLTQSGEVYTWGDARHRSLGRVTATMIEDRDNTSADKPGVVEALGGIKIVKIAAGGWMTAALSEDGAAYIWGTGTPGKEDSTIEILKDLDPSEVALVDIEDDASGEPMDVLDVAVGDGHVVLLMQTGQVFSSGENTNGQLGLGKTDLFVAEWEEVKMDQDVKYASVHTGPKNTFMKATKKDRERRITELTKAESDTVNNLVP